MVRAKCKAALALARLDEEARADPARCPASAQVRTLLSSLDIDIIDAATQPACLHPSYCAYLVPFSVSRRDHYYALLESSHLVLSSARQISLRKS